MSILICEACGEITQSDVCNLQSNIALECHARMLENSRVWTKGCAYDHCDSFAKYQADKLINPNKC